jgi:hypothetical protein
VTVTCTRCAAYIEAGNRRWPGYCGPRCRDRDRQEREAARQTRQQRRRTIREVRSLTARGYDLDEAQRLATQ